MPDPTQDLEPEHFAIPRRPWREKLRPVLIRERLEDILLIGPRRMRLRTRGPLILRQVVHALRLSRESLRRPVGFERLFLLGHPRSGTSWIGNFLGSHPDIAWGGEMWLQWNPRGLPLMLMPNRGSAWHLEHNLRWQARQQRRRYSAEKMLLSHIANRHFELDEIEDLWPDAKRIVVVRRNLGLQYISTRTASWTGQWALTADMTPRFVNLEVDIADFRRWREDREWRLRAFARHSIGQNALWLVYEELDGAPEAAFRDAVWPFLGLPDAPAVAHLLKQRQATLPERVANYAAVGAELEEAILPIETPGGRGYCMGPPPGILP